MEGCKEIGNTNRKHDQWKVAAKDYKSAFSHISCLNIRDYVSQRVR